MSGLLGDRGRLDGFVVHLANHDVTLAAVSRAPLPKLQAFKRRMGWRFPWASSFGDPRGLKVCWPWDDVAIREMPGG